MTRATENRGSYDPTTGTTVVSGAVTNTGIGTPAAAKITDPDAASATVVGLLRGILEEQQAQTVLLQTIATNTTP